MTAGQSRTTFRGDRWESAVGREDPPRPGLTVLTRPTRGFEGSLGMKRLIQPAVRPATSAPAGTVASASAPDSAPNHHRTA